jgi:hypothetical protein
VLVKQASFSPPYIAASTNNPKPILKISNFITTVSDGHAEVKIPYHKLQQEKKTMIKAKLPSNVYIYQL